MKSFTKVVLLSGLLVTLSSVAAFADCSAEHKGGHAEHSMENMNHMDMGDMGDMGDMETGGFMKREYEIDGDISVNAGGMKIDLNGDDVHVEGHGMNITVGE